MRTVLGIVREWIQWHALNGSTVTWGTDQILEFNRPLTVMDLEKLAVEIDEKLTASNSDYAKCKIEAEIKRLEENSEGDYVTRISALEWALRIIAERYKWERKG